MTAESHSALMFPTYPVVSFLSGRLEALKSFNSSLPGCAEALNKEMTGLFQSLQVSVPIAVTNAFSFC